MAGFRHLLSSKARRVRKRIVANAQWGIAHEPMIHYTQSAQRDNFLNRKPRSLPLNTDCSGSTTAFYLWAGAPDPNGEDYRSVGYTGTMLKHLPHIGRSDARRGDLVIFGSWPGDHVVILLQTPRYHKDPLVESHGGEAGPALLHLSDELSYFRGKAVTFLKGVPDDLK